MLRSLLSRLPSQRKQAALQSKLDQVKEKLANLQARHSDQKSRLAELKAQVSALKSASPLLVSDDFLGKRKVLAGTYLTGTGLEIGALHNPLPVPDHVTVRYADRFDTATARASYPELAAFDLVEVDFVCDGETLDTVPDASQDFVIANHVLEHCEDPIGALLNWCRVLVRGGILFVTVPDLRYTFDFRRPATPYAHLLVDHADGPERQNLQTYREWHTLVDVAEDPDTAARKSAQDRINIHFHAWTQAEILELLLNLRREQGVPMELECALGGGGEVVCVLRKVPVVSYDRAAAIGTGPG
ncbi:MAG: methyltransferase domain-containing protein [Akkermansiaceae bacterium]|nr:methyltransferase domain-containing protein [Akkermansiaceae bacterium]